MEKPKLFYLYPGSIFVHTDSFAVKTVLGSCVSVCLWDPILKAGGINHYQLTFWNGKGLATPKYGNIAIRQLIDKMSAIGSVKINLKAKIFGGASPLSTFSDIFEIGKENVRLAKNILAEHGIPIIKCNTGGTNGRILVFHTHSGTALVKYIEKLELKV